MSVSSSFLVNNNIFPQADPINQVRLAPDAPVLYKSDGTLNWEQSTWINPMSAMLKTFKNQGDNFLFNLNVSYQLPFGFELKVTGGYNSIHLKEFTATPIKSLNPASVATGSAGFGNKSIRTIIAEPQLLYRRRWKASNLDILTGISLQSTETLSLYQLGSGYTSDDVLYSLKSAASVFIGGEEDIRYRYAGIFGRIDYNVKNRYLVSASIRRDGSSRYGVENRFAYFGSVGTGWIFTKEKFFSSLKALSYGKLKASWGITGNDQIGDYRYLDIYAPYSYAYQGTTAFFPVQLYNPDFGWERVRKMEVGMDFGFIKDRLLFSINYYNNTTTNQLVSYSLPTMTGFSGVTRNVPSVIRNSGLETEISATIFKRKNLQWTASFNLTVPKNKLVSFEGFESSTYANTYAIGYPIAIARRYAYTGIDPTTGVYTFKDVNGDGKISSPADQKTIVSTAQKFYGGMQHQLSFKRVVADVMINFVSQPNAPNYAPKFGRPGTLVNQPLEVLNRWRKVGDKALMQRFTNSSTLGNTPFGNFITSDASYSNASYIRLRNVQLSYDINAFAASTGLNLKVFIQGQNLITITKYRGYDPETQMALPPIKLFTIGLQANF
jgi:hypothetical protein